MRNRKRDEGKQIDGLGILAICVVVAIIIGCVIAQVKIFKATGWQLLPSEPLTVHARTGQAEPAESPKSLHAEGPQIENSKFKSHPFGYVLLHDGTAVSLDSGQTFFPGAPDSNSPRTFLEQLTTGLETESSQAEWKMPASLPAGKSPMLKPHLAKADRITVAGQ